MTDEILSLRISTNDFVGKDRVEAFRENFGKAILRVEMEPIGGEIFEADMILNALPGFGMATGSISPIRNHHSTQLIDNDDLIIVLMNNGNATFERHGQATELRKGDVVITENDQAATFVGHTNTHVTNLRFSRERLVPLLADDFGGPIRGPKVRNSIALELLKHYADSVESGAPLSSPETRRLVVDHLYDLAALAIGVKRENKTVAKQRGLRAARLHAIKITILKNLGNRQLSAASLANNLGISQRYLQMLFEAEGTTFSQFLLVQRLKRAHRLLGDPALRSQTISAIAFEVGFNDLSYFNRTFRRMFGATPSDIREQAEKFWGN